MGCASSHTQKDLQSGDSEGAIEAAASALAGSFAKAGCDIEASAPGKDTGILPAEYAASLIGEDDHGAVDNCGEDGHSSLLGVVNNRSDTSDHVSDRKNSSPNIAAVERARAANRGRALRLSHGDGFGDGGEGL